MRFFRFLILVLFISLAFPCGVLANPFTPPPSLTEAVNFWKLVFAKYGKYQLVFHHRKDPGIIYSVLDFRGLAEVSSPAEYERIKKRESEREESRIRSTLRQLSTGATPSTAFEIRVANLFTRFPQSIRLRKYAEACEEDLIRSQTGIQNQYEAGLIRSRRYIQSMEKIFLQEGLPVELARVPFVESSFNYEAYSAVGAAGIWQFMRSTGKRYMRIDDKIDERRDPIIATRAAAQYLKNAYRVLGTWPLAVTSYNHGITGVLRASKAVGSTDLATIIRNYEGPGFGFASKSFFVSFLAALEVEQNYKTYFPGITLESPIQFDEVRLGRSVSFPELVRISSSGESTLASLNPALLKPILFGRSPVPAGFLFKVPAGRGKLIQNAVLGSFMFSVEHAPLSFEGKITTSVTKKPGLSKVSARKSQYRSVSKTIVKKAETKKSKPVQTYVIKRGDTPKSVALKFKKSEAKLRSVEKTLGGKWKPGTVITLP
jgi:membrane-bound lytic murein transglycosylase D